MKFDEILKACAGGKMPRVESNEPIKYTTETKGTVTTIKSNGKHCGVGVTFDGLDYEFFTNPMRLIIGRGTLGN